MPAEINQSKFITFEGGEGGGKSTQVKLLAEYLQNAGHEVVITREPGGTELAEEIRKLLVRKEMDAMTEVLLNFAARKGHVENLIKPALSEGKWVICDRFFDSTYVYQGFAGGVDIKKIDAIRAAAIADFTPNITFLLDIDPLIGLKRAEERGEQNRYEEKGLEYHQKVREGFLKLAKENKRIIAVDARESAAKVHQEILSKLS